MTKHMEIRDGVFQRLDQRKGGHESWSDVIESLLDAEEKYANENKHIISIVRSIQRGEGDALIATLLDDHDTADYTSLTSSERLSGKINRLIIHSFEKQKPIKIYYKTIPGEPVKLGDKSVISNYIVDIDLR